MSLSAAALTDATPERRGLLKGNWTIRIIVAGLIVALYLPTLADLASEWWTAEASSYGLLIPPLALYIAYLRRQEIFSCRARPETKGLWLVGFACLMFLFGGLAAEFFLSRVSIVLLLAGLVWTFWGRERLRLLAFPFILLTTMVPPPILVYNAVAAPLQLFASSVATSVAQAVGVSVFCEGNIIHLATTSLGVEEACSGLQSLYALVVGSLLLGHVENGSTVGRVILFLLAVPLAIGVNVLRVAGTAVLADYQPEFAMGFYHLFSGWLIFLVGFAILWLLGKFLFHFLGRQS